MLTARFDRLRLAPGERVLDLGCGEGRHCHGLHMLGGVEVVGVDLDEPSLEKARAGLETLPPRRPDDPTKTSFSVADATALPFPDDSFDALICSEVLEHLPDYPAAIKEMRRVLKPGGRLCVTVPRAWPEKICWRFAPPPKGYPFDPGGHLRIFHRIGAALRGGGARVQTCRPPSRPRAARALLVAEDLVLAAKEGSGRGPRLSPFFGLGFDEATLADPPSGMGADACDGQEPGALFRGEAEMNVAATTDLAGYRILSRLRGATDRILETQEADGAIPWFEDGPWDPWNHVEAAMALSVMGLHEAADAAYRCLAARQESDGSWLGEYGSALPIVDRLYIAREPAPAFKDTNFIAYVATGVWHRLLCAGDRAAARAAFPMVAAAIDFVLALQATDGAIGWSEEAAGTSVDEALLAGNACIAKSLDCALALAEAVGERRPDWRAARARLVQALRERPDLFDGTGRGARYAMDWYYPALSGALSVEEARERLAGDAERFIETDRGCRCVADEPWVTVAESAELAIALCAAGERAAARRLFDAQFRVVDRQGAFWMGWQSVERIFWPREKPAWTQGAMVLAADAIHELSPAARVLTRSASEAAEHAEAFHGFDLLEQA